jgi:hypothetical protein
MDGAECGIAKLANDKHNCPANLCSSAYSAARAALALIGGRPNRQGAAGRIARYIREYLLLGFLAQSVLTSPGRWVRSNRPESQSKKEEASCCEKW